MAILINNDRIQFTNYALRVTPRGLSVVLANSNSVANFTAANITYTNSFQGENHGFVSGGMIAPSTYATNVIDKFSLTTYEYATDVGDLTLSRYAAAGLSSSVSGYSAGGRDQTTTSFNTVDKFQFASNRNATDVGDLTTALQGAAGASSTTAGYAFGGSSSPGSLANTVQKFPFATDTNAALVAGTNPIRKYPTAPTVPQTSMSAFRVHATGITDIVNDYAYVATGYGIAYPAAPASYSMLNNIDRFSYVTDMFSPFGPVDNGPNFLFITTSRQVAYGAGISSKTHGYIAGGSTSFPSLGPSAVSSIQKFPFSIYSSSTTVGDLYVAAAVPSGTFTFATSFVYGAAGISAEHSGYVAGGANSTTVALNSVDSFPFATDMNAMDVTDLTTSRSQATGHQF